MGPVTRVIAEVSDKTVEPVATGSKVIGRGVKRFGSRFAASFREEQARVDERKAYKAELRRTLDEGIEVIEEEVKAKMSKPAKVVTSTEARKPRTSKPKVTTA